MKISSIIIVCLIVSGIGCSVGTKVNIEANNLDYPVSQSLSVFIPNGEFLVTNNYESISEFRYTFKKWGNSTINLSSDVDISDQLNEIIESKGGDAIVNLQFSMRNTGTNSMMVVVKSVALLGSLIATAVTLTEPTSASAAFAGGSIIGYILTPANIDVEISGTVVKFTD